MISSVTDPAGTPNPPESVQRAKDTLQHAMVLRRAAAVERPSELLIDEEVFALSQDAFWFKTPNGATFAYGVGGQLTASYDCEALEDEVHLYQWGTAYGAVAWLNGFVPLHASAVARGGRAIAFTGSSGAGKSTLAAALVKCGHKLICDDTLVLVPSQDGWFALPDGRPLKLWKQASAFVGLSGGDPIGSVPGKAYHVPDHRQAYPVVMSDLLFLEEGNRAALEPIKGSAKFERLLAAFYRGFVHSARAEQADHTDILLDLAGGIHFWTLQRPLIPADFDRVVGEIEALFEIKLKSSGNPLVDG